VLARRLAEDRHAVQHRRHPDRHPQQEDRPPADRVHQIAAGHRPGHRRHQHRQPEHPHHRATLARWGRLEDDRHPQRHHQRPADPLEHPAQDQDVNGGRQAAQRREEGEQPDRPEVRPLGPEPIGQEAGRRHHHGQRQHVRRQDELTLVHRRLEYLDHARQRHVDDRLV
jgi:hypothetical protein